MFGNKYNELKEEVKEIKKALVGIDLAPNSLEKPACYSYLAKIDNADESIARVNSILHMLLEQLGYELEEGIRVVKVKKK